VRLRALPVNRALLAQDKEAMKKKIADAAPAAHDERSAA
jgi:isoquinoline 1-oxidoreductase beta subunit